MDERWIEATSEVAAEQSVLTVNVLRPKQEQSFAEITLPQYCRLIRLCYPNVRWEDAKRTPTRFKLTVFKLKDLGREGLSVDSVICACKGYIGQAMDDTAADRKAFGVRVAEAGVKRRGGELSGGAGHGRSR